MSLTTSMAALSMEPPCIIIHPASDLEVRLYTTKDVSANATFKAAGQGNYMTRGKVIASMHVSRNVLIENSPTLKAMLSSGFKESNQSVIDLEDNNVVALELWFRRLHDTLNNASYKLSVPEIYTVIERSHYYFFHLEKLGTWFEKWYQTNKTKIIGMSVGKETEVMNMNELELLVYPCRQFDFARGFTDTTRRLAYENRGHISLYNHNPKTLHLQILPRIVGGINGARTNLAHKIHEWLYIHHTFITLACKCKKEGLFEYESALLRTEAWPLMVTTRGHNQMSVADILEALLLFQYKAPEGGCSFCSQNFDSRVMKVRRGAEKQFDGLCLDCIKNPVRKDKLEFAVIEDGKKIFDRGCRVRHGQPTWWFSWLSSDQYADVHEKEREERKRLAALEKMKKETYEMCKLPKW